MPLALLCYPSQLAGIDVKCRSFIIDIMYYGTHVHWKSAKKRSLEETDGNDDDLILNSAYVLLFK